MKDEELDRSGDWDRLAAELAGELSVADQAELRAWLAEDPARAQLAASTAELWEALKAADKQWDTRSAWERVRSRMGEDAGAKTVARPPMRGLDRGSPQSARTGGSKLGSGGGQRALMAAAVIAVLLIGGLYQRTRNPNEGPARLDTVQELITQKGERAQARLADGTRVILGPETRLRISPSFGRDTREVELSGEAFFDVEPDPSRPFVVSAGATTTRVLGTEFDVRAYPVDSTVQVVVAEGSVSMRATTQSDGPAVTLAPGDLAVMVGTTGTISVRRVDLEPYLGWQTGHLVFEDAPLSQVVTQLERWYGKPVRIGDETLRTRRLSASFRDTPVDEVMAAIAASLEMRYEKTGETYTFFPRKKPTTLAGL